MFFGRSVVPSSGRSSHAVVVDGHGRVHLWRDFEDRWLVLNNLWILNLHADLAKTWTDAGILCVACVRPLPAGRAPARQGVRRVGRGHTVTLSLSAGWWFRGDSTSGAVNDGEIFDLEIQ